MHRLPGVENPGLIEEKPPPGVEHDGSRDHGSFSVPEGLSVT
jgi:hypothetical protein